MITIHKFPFKVSDFVAMEMPDKCKIIQVGLDPQLQPCIWAFVDTEAKKVLRKFRVRGTGQPIDDKDYEFNYIDSFVDGPFVWHLFFDPT